MMTDIQIVSSTWQPPSDRVWQAMCSNPAKYAPLIERVVGYMLFVGYRDDDDASNKFLFGFEEFARQTPWLAALSEDEQEFVQVGASVVIYEYDPGFDVRQNVRHWMTDGGVQ